MHRNLIRIGIDATPSCTSIPAGCARYAASLIDALLALDDFRRRYELTLFYRLSRLKTRRLRYLPPTIPARWYQGRFFPISKGVDLLHGTDADIPAWTGVAMIATVHDLAIFRDEYQYEMFSPKAFREKKWGQYKQIARNAQAIIAVSETTKRDFLDLFQFPEERVFVVYEGVDDKFKYEPTRAALDAEVLDQYDLGPGYLLFVGAISVRKNLLNLVEAYRQSRASGDLPLVLVGSLSHAGDHVIRRVAELGLKNRVRFLGHVPESHLPAIYSHAAGLLFATFYEGFGFPILEAMLSKIPVLIGDRGASSEIAGGHGIVVNPGNTDSIADGIDRLLRLGEDQLEAAYHHAEKFTWAECAKGTMEIYRHVLGIQV